MNEPQDDPRRKLRWSVYALLICVSVGAMLGRILAVDSVDKVGLEANRLDAIAGKLAKKRADLAKRGVSGERLAAELERTEAALRRDALLRRPFLSANDRSRWCAVRALVEEEMRVPGKPYAIDRVIQEENWDTIDMVKHDGHLYSSKPPLLPTLMAAVYWPVHRLSGANLRDNPHEIDRFMLIVFNVVPLVVYFVLLAALVERFGATDWGRMFVVAACCFGTFLTTFAVAINNHLPAAVCAAAALFAAVRIWFDDRRGWGYFFLAGLFGALAVSNELPAASLLAALGVSLLIKAPRLTFLAFAPAALLVAAVFFGTNYIAHGTLAPPYAHRGGEGEDNWYDYTYQRIGRTIESYWMSHWKNTKKFDRGEESRSVYAFNVLIGHHGIFSLTPVWLLSFAGMGAWILRRGDPRLRWAAAGAAAISLACLAFYLGQPVINRNYGGMTSGLRWMFWLAPLWLLMMLPAVDFFAARRWTRGLALILLAFSVLSVSYPTWNPWSNPWLYNLSRYMEWVKYP
ncbi:MAG: hypothetical protein JW959_03955 [Pirellulales bacterium]|nr:hypothetical protein [Pirellulales bacterium]